MVASVSNTCYGIIHDAMFDAGLLQRGQLPNSDELASNMRRLCDIVNLYQTEGIKLFLYEDISINLVESQSTYTIYSSGDVAMDKPLQVLQGYILNTDDIRRPIISMSWDEWMRLSQITGNDGMVSSYFVDKQATQLNVHLWNPPDATEAANTAHLLVRTQASNPVNLEANMSFPQEWRMALRWALADDISTGQPAAIMERCESKALYYKEILEGFDVEDAGTFFAPDTRMNIGGRSFT